MTFTGRTPRPKVGRQRSPVGKGVLLRTNSRPRPLLKFQARGRMLETNLQQSVPIRCSRGIRLGVYKAISLQRIILVFCVFTILCFSFSTVCSFVLPRSSPSGFRFHGSSLSCLRSTSRTLPAPRSFAPRYLVTSQNPSQLLALHSLWSHDAPAEFLRVPQLPTSPQFATTIRSRSPPVLFFIKRAIPTLCVTLVFWASPAVHKNVQLDFPSLNTYPPVYLLQRIQKHRVGDS